MNTFRSMCQLFAIAGVAGVAACAAAVPPQDLVNARSAYKRASNGPAAQFNPAGMDDARKQLEVAEDRFTEDGDTQATRDQSYLAVRKTELAEVVARTMQSRQTRENVVGSMHADQKRAVAGTAAALGRSNAQVNAQGIALDAQGRALVDEKSRREDAETRAAQALADLAKLAQVKQEPRGMVITLSGSVLFVSAKADLLPGALVKLNDIADALNKAGPASKMVVEGHTDSRGTAAYNQDLSQRRAQAVRDYLVTRGVASERITAQGFGPTRSVADNASAEGRANNRRVEIVVQKSTPAP